MLLRAGFSGRVLWGTPGGAWGVERLRGIQVQVEAARRVGVWKACAGGRDRGAERGGWPMQGVQVQSLVAELRSCMLLGTASFFNPGNLHSSLEGGT